MIYLKLKSDFKSSSLVCFKQIALERLIFLNLRLQVFGIYTLNPPALAGE